MTDCKGRFEESAIVLVTGTVTGMAPSLDAASNLVLQDLVLAATPVLYLSNKHVLLAVVILSTDLLNNLL